MKRIIMIFTVFCVILGCLTGCSGAKGSDGKSSSEKLSAGSEAAYIPVRMEFLTPNKVKPDGKAYIDVIEDAESEEWKNASEIPEFILFSEKVIYFDEKEFMQFSVDGMPGKRRYYSGEYNIEGDGKVNLEYQYYIFKNNYKDEEWYVDLESGQTNMEENSRNLYDTKSRLENANDYDYVLNASGMINPNDKHPYMLSPHWHSAKEDGDNWEQKFKPDEELETELYSKGDFMVAKQKGYSFDGDVSKKEFTLKYDDSDIDPENSYKWKMTMKFNSDNTWESDYHDSGYSGTWKLMYDNLLVIYPPEDDKKYSENNITLLYLDFENEEIYVPVFIRCDEMIEFAREYKESKYD